MTWKDLINELQSIPENRREEKATFLSREDDQAYEIDCREEISMDELTCDCNTGNDETNTTFVIST